MFSKLEYSQKILTTVNVMKNSHLVKAIQSTMWDYVGTCYIFFVIDPFCTHYFICLNIGFWYGSFVWKWCVLNVSIFSLKTVLQFFKKVFVFQKICFKVKVLKTFKISTDFRIKTCRSLKWRAILKISSAVF